MIIMKWCAKCLASEKLREIVAQEQDHEIDPKDALDQVSTIIRRRQRIAKTQAGTSTALAVMGLQH